MCYFVNACFREREVSILVDALNPLCGWNLTMDEFFETGKRILTLQRAYSHREAGHDRKDDTMSGRMFDVPLPTGDGPRGGQVIPREQLAKTQDEFYTLVGWEKDGLPSDATLKKMGLDFVIADMRKKK